MSDAVAPSPSPASAGPAGGQVSSRPRSISSQILGDALRSWGARLGLIYLLLMAITAVFAPFLANSHPVLMKRDGQWSSPLLRHLTPGDLVLLVMFFATAALYFVRRLSGAQRLAILALTLAVAWPLAFFTVRPPVQVVYDQYRVGLAKGQIEQAWFAPLPYSPDDRLRDQPEKRLNEPSLAHPMGTTNNAADLASNMIHATRIALSIGFISTGIAMVIGVTLGGLMGYFSGLVDLLGMRLVEIFSAIPTLLLLLTFVAVFQPNLYAMMAIIGATSWVGDAVFVRAEFLRLREQDFVQAARATGLPLHSILFRHMLPNGITPVLVNASFGVAGAILAESTLSFLGIGLVAEASWGNLLNQALGSGGVFHWWIALYPGLAIFLTVFAYNLIGEAMRDAIDPTVNRRRS